MTASTKNAADSISTWQALACCNEWKNQLFDEHTVAGTFHTVVKRTIISQNDEATTLMLKRLYTKHMNVFLVPVTTMYNKPK